MPALARTPACLFALLAATVLHAQTPADLGTHTAFTLPRAGDWERHDSVTPQLDGGTLRLRHTGVEVGWIVARARFAIDESAVLHLSVPQISGGDLSVQIEWFDEGSAFLGASTALDRINESGVQTRVKLGEVMGAAIRRKQPQSARVKVWIAGDAAQATIDRLEITWPRKWNKPQTTLVQALPANTSVKPDAGLTTAVDGDAIAMKLDAGTPYSGLVLEPMLPLNPQGVVLLDLAALQGRVSLQLVCFDANGVYLKSIDVMKEIDMAGLYEVPLSIYRSALPQGATTFQFKLWLAGEGAPRAHLASIHYGQRP
jgi:hypothetical protein